MLMAESSAYQIISNSGNAIGNGEEAQVLKEAAAIVLDYCGSEDFTSVQLSSPDGTLYLMMPTEDRRGWMLFRTSNNFS